METQPGVLVLAATPIGRVADAPRRLAGVPKRDVYNLVHGAQA